MYPSQPCGERQHLPLSLGIVGVRFTHTQDPSTQVPSFFIFHKLLCNLCVRVASKRQRKFCFLDQARRKTKHKQRVKHFIYPLVNHNDTTATRIKDYTQRIRVELKKNNYFLFVFSSFQCKR